MIAFAQKHFASSPHEKFTNDSNNYPQENLVYIGQAAVMGTLTKNPKIQYKDLSSDPPRPETMEASQQCKDAGIKVYMITGDHPTCAAAIASQIGLLTGLVKNDGKLEVKSSQTDSALILGETLKTLSQNEWTELLKKKYIVFARTTPEQKLMIVEELQKRDETVAVTGKSKLL